jgi:hypothetical protein
LARRPTPLRLERPAGQDREYVARAGQPASSPRTELRHDPRGHPLPASRQQQVSSADTRTLIATLVLIALIPNLTVAALVWRSQANQGWSAATTPTAQPQTASVAGSHGVQSAQATLILPVLTAPATLTAKAGEAIAFPIAVDGTDGVPARSSIAINGLPVGATLSDGRPYGKAGWNLKSDEIGDLSLTLPRSATGETKLGIQLIGPDGDVLASAETIVRTTEPEASLPAVSDGGEPKVENAAIQPNDVSHESGSGGVEMKPDEPAVVNVPASGAPPAEPSAPGATADADANADAKWFQAPTFVNLRERPSSSSRVISVVAKGAKLSVLDHKRGWVKVSNPTTSETGWVYAGTANASRYGGKGKSASGSSSDDSFWTNVGKWFAGP